MRVLGMIEVGQCCIFKFKSNFPIRDSKGPSPDVKNKYTKWKQISGRQVVVTKVDTYDSLVYIKQDGPDFWFRSLHKYLFQCKCDLTLLMNRGCQCGFFGIEQASLQKMQK